MMKKMFIITLLSISIALTGVSSNGSVSAADSSPGNLIDDSIYDNKSSMNETQIQNFINAFPNSCLLPKNYPSGLSPVTFKEPLDYFSYGTDVSPAKIIWKTSQMYGMNPQVILATLEKEQNLVTGNAGCAVWKYNSAIGYNCPDGSENALKDYPNIQIYDTCVAKESNAGFSRQVNHATWQLKFDKERAYGNVYWGDDGDHATQYFGRMTQGDRKRRYDLPSYYYDGYTNIDGQAIYLSNGATAALYNFTPHFSNFKTIFTQWFGSTHLNDYQWSPSSQAVYADSNLSTDTQPFLEGQRRFVQIKVTNNGVATWRKWQTFLATTNPRDRQSALYDSTWVRDNRAATIKEESVAPGAIATFEFWVTGSKAGNYNEYFSLVQEGVTWFNDHGLYIPFNVQQSRYEWSVSNQQLFANSDYTNPLPWSASVTRGETIYGRVTALNTGNVTWSNTGQNPIKIATSNPKDRASSFCNSSWGGCARPTVMKEESVAPGQTGTFEFQLQPSAAGSYREHYRLVAEGKTWFNDTGMYFSINAPERQYKWSVTSQKAFADSGLTQALPYSITMNKGESVYLELKLKNEGNMAWNKSVALATSSPQDRASSFYNSTWISPNRAGVYQENQLIKPGETATFIVKITANSTGSYREYLRPVWEGQSWFNDLGLYYPITVQ